MSEPDFRLASTVLGTSDVARLAAFYEQLLGWVRLADESGWAKLVPLDPISGEPDRSAVGLSVHHDEHFRAPTWPSTLDRCPMTAHLDVAVSDLARGVDAAVALGARVADHQPQGDVRVMLDPDGHPFCLFADPRRFPAVDEVPNS